MFLLADPARAAPARSHLTAALGVSSRARAESFLNACPRHAPTPLVSLPGLATRLGVASLAVKDEGQRLGLRSFKALGGAYAVMSLVLEQAQARLGRALTPADLAAPEIRAVAAGMTVTAATDGNHGRSVAAGARIAGCGCVIFIHGGVSAARAEAIARFGAEVRRTEGSYDDSVREAAEVAAREGWTVVSDTSWEGYEDIPLTVMQGYTVMAGEALDRLAEPPTHLFLQAGVGGMAAAVAAHAAAVLGVHAPVVAVVEPARAACLFASAQAGRAVEIPHGEPTVMGMLECCAPSPIAWEVLAPLAAGFVTLEEEEAPAAMKRLAFPERGDPAIVAGESGCTGLAGLMQCLADPAARAALKLGPDARILLFNSEGATDPALYEALVGVAPGAITGSSHDR
jgi:diaminopropionate ammonia-lyase